jgi:hypothetical protein
MDRLLPSMTAAFALASALLPGGSARAEDAPGLTERASVSSAGVEGDNTSAQTTVSDDGRYVAFASYASNLVPDDVALCDSPVGPVSCFDVFVRDRRMGRTVRVSVADDGSEAACPPGTDLFGCSADPALSKSGRWVAFDSIATNLVAGDANGTRDVFVHDRDADRDGVFDEPGAIANVLVSVTSAGVQGDDSSSAAAISADGRHVAFVSLARLVPGDRNLHADVYVHDRDTDGDGVFDEPGAVATICASAAGDGTVGNGFAEFPAISADGRHVVFDAFANNLVPGDTNFARDVFAHDRDADRDGVYDEPGAVATRRLSVSSDGAQSDYESFAADVSADGRYVAFSSWASTLVPDDPPDCRGSYPGCSDIFVRDRDADADGRYDEPGATTTTRVSLSTAGVPGDEDSLFPTLAAGARLVAFQSYASNLVPGDDGRASDVFVRDRDTDGDGILDEPGAVATERVSVTPGGRGGNSDSEDAALATSGVVVAFTSFASNLVRGDRNGAPDAFVRDRAAVACSGLRATIVGSDGADFLTGTPGPDVVNALGGDDEVRGLGGDDVLCGGTGADRLLGEAGRDRLRGDAGDDALDGGDGGDLCAGNAHDSGDSAQNCELVRGVP